MRKKLISIPAIVAILCLTPIFVIWASAEQQGTLNLVIDVTGVSYGRGKGSCIQALSGTIEVELLPHAQTFGYTNEIGNVSSTVSYSYDLASLTLVEGIMVHIHIDGAFRRLNIGETAPITLLEIMGCTSIDTDSGVQYCVNAYYAIPSPDVGNIGTVTKTGSNTWWVDASIPAHEQGGPSLCVSLWEQGIDEPIDGFCIPLYDFEVICTGEIAS